MGIQKRRCMLGIYIPSSIYYSLTKHTHAPRPTRSTKSDVRSPLLMPVHRSNLNLDFDASRNAVLSKSPKGKGYPMISTAVADGLTSYLSLCPLGPGRPRVLATCMDQFLDFFGLVLAWSCPLGIVPFAPLLSNDKVTRQALRLGSAWILRASGMRKLIQHTID